MENEPDPAEDARGGGPGPFGALSRLGNRDQWLWWLAVCGASLAVSISVVFDYVQRIAGSDAGLGRLPLHDSIVDATADAPYRYRVLVPRVLDLFIRTGSDAAARQMSFDSVYHTYFVLALTATLVLLVAVARRFVQPGSAVAGSFLFAACLPIALRDHGFQPWSMIEPVFVCLALLSATRKQSVWVAVALTVPATLNRETAFVVPLVYGAIWLRECVASRSIELRRVVPAASAAVVWGLTFWLLRVVQGNAKPVDYALVDSLNDGVGRHWIAGRNVLLFTGGVLVLCFVAVATNRADRRLLWVAAVVFPPYLASIYLYGVWSEVRLLMPMFPILLPIGLAALERTGSPSVSEADRVGVQK